MVLLISALSQKPVSGFELQVHGLLKATAMLFGESVSYAEGVLESQFHV